MKKLTLIVAVLFVATVANSPLSAAGPDINRVKQPPAGYNTAEVFALVKNDIGEIPIRRGFYDADIVNRYRAPEKGEGFGLDKAANRHNVEEINLIKYIFGGDGTITQSEDGTYGTSFEFGTQIITQFCTDNPYTGIPICDTPNGPFNVIAVADVGYYDYYYDWPASIADDRPVGLITAYCLDGEPNPQNPKVTLCKDEVNDPINRDLINQIA